jgi:UDP-N-acetylmuramoylalanine--D-glutamate ligase
MILAEDFGGRRVAVVGMARSGLTAAQALAAGGAEVVCWDDGERGRAAAEAMGLRVADLRTADWGTIDALLLSPGVPLTHPQPHWTVELAKAASVPVIGDTELFSSAWRKRTDIKRPLLVAITGTNGKSTTTALTAHLFKALGLRTAMGGNIGEAVMGLSPLAETDAYVLEFSSYQIDLTPSLSPDVGILLNLSPDHLDRHGSMENYAAVKERLALAAKLAVIGVDDPYCRAIALRRLAAGRPTVGVHVTADETRAEGQVTAEDIQEFVTAGGSLLLAYPGEKLRMANEGGGLADLAGIPTLRGSHNAQNAAAAFAACQFAGFAAGDISRHLRSYPGLAHRMQMVGWQGRTLFVNDSKATNADAAAKGLASYRDIHWIVGGRPKEGGITPLTPYFGRIARAYLIGEAAEQFAATLAGQVPAEMCGTLDIAVAAAARAAEASGTPEPVVLLSPACASFDQFPDFEKRGAAFAAAVAALPGFRPPG